jgi:cystathionine beta-lyase/cystathionine gamma-synthase
MREKMGISDRLIRLAIGLEAVSSLKDDLEGAFRSAS